MPSRGCCWDVAFVSYCYSLIRSKSIQISTNQSKSSTCLWGRKWKSDHMNQVRKHDQHCWACCANGCEEPEMMSQDIATCINFGMGIHGIHIWPVACYVSRELLMLVRPAFAAFEVGMGQDGQRWAIAEGFQCPFSGDPKRCHAATKELQGFLRRVNCKGSTRIWRTIWYLYLDPCGTSNMAGSLLTIWVNYLGEPSTIYKICKHIYIYRHCVVYRWIDG